ncbi:hypothetical protein M426DRAFT_323334 [Hypoxylon sp. CI-4A]|nr:hypothetical protein M426DRAFT_323334 [Hypoxylon sp. CI-4A]
MSMDGDSMLHYGGKIVPRSFRPDFVVISYVVSCIGAAMTLELLNRRTSRNGLFNHLILGSAAVSMGGISIWCMHFVGSRAIILADDEPEFRVDYSNGFSALSFFLPVVVLLAAFTIAAASDKISRWRVSFGGVLAGAGICGMHYLGNASIDNYHLIYNMNHVVGAAIIAVFDSTLALSLFFVVGTSWTNAWWKRALSAFLLATGASGMHWIAASGTSYRLLKLNENSDVSQSHAIEIVICLSVAAAIFMIGSVIYAVLVTNRIASKAQQVVLAAAVFDKSGRILVTLDGSLPKEKITDSYVERAQGDSFGIAHPLFHWMFQVSRNWNSVSGMIHAMVNHLGSLPKASRSGQARLIDDDEKPVENYDAIFCELFCVAAATLADKLREQLVDVGVLWDEILTTGTDQMPQKIDKGIDRMLEEGIPNIGGGRRKHRGIANRVKPKQEHERGSLMFLVRRLENAQDVNRLEASGFRFVEIHRVYGIIGSRMHIKSRDLKGKLSNMANCAQETNVMKSGVHLGFFGVKPRIGNFGFDVVTKRGARNLLPTMPVPLERLEPWQMSIIRQLNRMSVPLLFENLNALKKLSPREVLFASQLSDALQALRAWIDEPIFDEAVLTSKVVQVPCRTQAGYNSAKNCTMIALCMMMPIHARATSPRCEYVPLNFFKVHQMAYRNSPQLAAFTRYVHRELSPIVYSVPIKPPQTTYQRAGRAIFSKQHFQFNSLPHPRRLKTNSYASVGSDYLAPTRPGRKSSSRESNYAPSVTELTSRNSHDSHGPNDDAIPDKLVPQPLSSLGGIMVSQEIQVDIRQIDDDTSGGLSAPLKKADRVTMVKAGAGFDFEMDSLEDMPTGKLSGSAMAVHEKVNEVITFVDELFAVCVDGL